MNRHGLPPLRGGSGYLGWFGKLPSVGDFASRGIPAPLRDVVHRWIASGMARLAETQPDDWREAYLVSPVWHFVMNARVWDAPALLGCLAPSLDKVGRCSPLIALRAFDSQRLREVIPPSSQWLYRVDAVLRRAIGEPLAVDSVLTELERERFGEAGIDHPADSAGDILHELGIAATEAPARTWFSWPDLPERFDERSGRSFWWAEPSPKMPPLQVIHAGVPDDELLALLMGGWIRS